MSAAERPSRTPSARRGRQRCELAARPGGAWTEHPGESPVLPGKAGAAGAGAPRVCPRASGVRGRGAPGARSLGKVTPGAALRVAPPRARPAAARCGGPAGCSELDFPGLWGEAAAEGPGWTAAPWAADAQPGGGSARRGGRPAPRAGSRGAWAAAPPSGGRWKAPAASLARGCGTGDRRRAPGRPGCPRGRCQPAPDAAPPPSSAVGEECGGDSRSRHLPDIANSPDFLSPGPDPPRDSSELLDRARGCSVAWALRVVVAVGEEPGVRGRRGVRLGRSCRFVKETLLRSPDLPSATGDCGLDLGRSRGLCLAVHLGGRVGAGTRGPARRPARRQRPSPLFR